MSYEKMKVGGLNNLLNNEFKFYDEDSFTEEEGEI